MNVTNIRSARHLAKEVGTSLRTVLINFRECGWSFCKVIMINRNTTFPADALLIFNRQYNTGLLRMNNALSFSELDNSRVELSGNFNKLICITGEELGNTEFNHLISGMILLPESFDEEYNKFVKENTKTINTLVRKYGFSMLEDYIKRIYIYTGGSKNFFVWAINTYFQNHTSLNAIKRIMWWNENYGQLAKNLSKSTITAYTSKSDIYTLFDEMTELRREKRINDVINTFNTAQKKILKNAEISTEDKKVISSFYRLSESKKLNFVRKMSTIDDYSEIMRQMRHITSTHYSWNKDSFIDYIMNVENMNYEKVYEKDNIILIKVNDFETIKHLAKTTNWCISKNKSYWNQYVERVPDATQYMLFDFGQKEDNVLSIVGFTTRYNKGITNAHNFVNNNMLNDNVVSTNSLINSYIARFRATNCGIYNFLTNCGIDLNLVAKYDKPLFEWNRDSMFKYLYECVNKGNVEILTDKNGMVAISVKDKNVRYFLGDTYIDNVEKEFWGWQHIIFMDFNMNQFDPNRIQYALIKNNPCGDEDYCTTMYNEHHMECNSSFDTKLTQFGLPYTTIRRVNDKYVRLRDAIMSFNVPIVMKEARDKELFSEVINDYVGNDNMADIMRTSIIDYVSFDYLDVFYSNGYTLGEFFSDSLIGTLISHCMANVIMDSRTNKMSSCPTAEDVTMFFEKKTPTINETRYIGIFLALDKIVSHEIVPGRKADVIFKKTLRSIITNGVSVKENEGVYDHFVDMVLPFINDNVSGEFFSLLKKYGETVAGDTTKSKILEYVSKNQKFKDNSEKEEEYYYGDEQDVPAFNEVVRDDLEPLEPPMEFEEPAFVGADAIEQ